MKILFYSFLIFAANMGSIYPSEMSWDDLSDQQIESCLNSDTFQNMPLLYSYEGQNWQLRIIFNPCDERIVLNNGQPSMFQFYYGVFSQDRISESLESHLKEIINGKLERKSGGFWSIGSTINGTLSIDYFADAKAELSQTNTQNEAVRETAQISKACNAMDQEISGLFKEQTFRKLSLDYEWEGKSYSVHFVHNPLREALFCSELSKPVTWPFAMTIAASTYPLSLAKYLKNLVPRELLRDPDSVIDVADWVSYFRKNSVSLYKNLDAIELLHEVENPDMDVEIQTFFTSSQLSRKSLFYELDGKFYKVLLIHNPEKLILRSSLSFDTQENGRLDHTVTWSSKIGIFVDKAAPQRLIDHISQFYELLWWDSWCNLSIHNGDKVSVTYLRGSWKYTYAPYSWYTFMLNAKL